MDKETLSHYGWIVIAVLVLAVMLTFAGPFGTFVADAVKSTTQGLFDVNQGALDAAGITIADQNFVDHNGTDIPVGAVYTRADGTVLNAGEAFPVVEYGDIYTYGDYEYCYGYRWCTAYDICDDWSNQCEHTRTIDGWGVRVQDYTKTTYGAILESIRGEPIVDMDSAFAYCTQLITAPSIPINVKILKWAFWGCTKLTTAPVIPSSVTNMEGTFHKCTSLTSKPAIPNSVTTAESSIFEGCPQFGY